MFFLFLFLFVFLLSFVAITITAEHSFWAIQHAGPSCLKQAAKIYIKSSNAKSVSHQIQTVFQAKSSEIPAFTQNEEDNDLLYNTQIVLPLSDIICSNLLRAFIPKFYYTIPFLHSFSAH